MPHHLEVEHLLAGLMAAIDDFSTKTTKAYVPVSSMRQFYG
jgi:hypothetical protein